MTETWRVYPVIMSYVPANQPTPYLVEIPAFQGETQGRSVADGMRQARTYM
ncbi:HicB family protein [Lactobacillus brevis] [Lactiplantibacillus mudanjiangensis]|nr:HicB family protein [Lactobacillus brevis] [Lactiplantibacillus mudanjiangensis]